MPQRSTRESASFGRGPGRDGRASAISRRREDVERMTMEFPACAGSALGRHLRGECIEPGSRLGSHLDKEVFGLCLIVRRASAGPVCSAGLSRVSPASGWPRPYLIDQFAAPFHVVAKASGNTDRNDFVQELSLRIEHAGFGRSRCALGRPGRCLLDGCRHLCTTRSANSLPMTGCSPDCLKAAAKKGTTKIVGPTAALISSGGAITTDHSFAAATDCSPIACRIPRRCQQAIDKSTCLR